MNFKLNSQLRNSFFGFCVAVLFIVFFYEIKEVNLSTSITVNLGSAPSSSDPIDFDAMAHHIIFKPVFSTLVTHYKKGKMQGLLAKSWESNSNLDTWNFEIRKDLKYSNGDFIDAYAIAKSLARIAWIEKSNNSQSGILEFLKGYDTFNSIKKLPSGIEVIDAFHLKLSFTKPIIDLLENLAFGVYGITHLNDYNPSTGKWLNSRKAIASGPYEISSWSDNEFSLKKRSNSFVDYINENAPDLIKAYWDNRSADLTIGSSLDQYSKNKYKFVGNNNSSILFLRCYTWKNKESIFYNIENRRVIRNSFYQQLEKIDYPVIRSFFNPTISGIKEFKDPNLEIYNNIDNREISFRFSKISSNQFLNSQLKIALRKINIRSNEKSFKSFEEQNKAKNPNTPNISIDVGIWGTSMTVENPNNPYLDIRFMFFSDRGVKLPDLSGKAKIELIKEKPNFQIINEIIWDDAIIWPITHYSIGVWYNTEKLDYSLIDTLLPPTDLSLIGVK